MIITIVHLLSISNFSFINKPVDFQRVKRLGICFRLIKFTYFYKNISISDSKFKSDSAHSYVTEFLWMSTFKFLLGRRIHVAISNEIFFYITPGNSTENHRKTFLAAPITCSRANEQPTYCGGVGCGAYCPTPTSKFKVNTRQVTGCPVGCTTRGCVCATGYARDSTGACILITSCRK